ncbi:MAG: hypothetical protein AAFZ52_11930, partial [Bacteroidota bacterium]
MTRFYLLLGALFWLTGVAHAQLDNITGVTLTFTPTTGSAVTATATDSGNGLAVDGDITLDESTDYTVAVTLSSGGTDITSQVTAGADEHQVFFAPTGSFLNGDVDATDMDGNGLPLGLANTTTTECTENAGVGGMLRVVLSDLGDMKSATSAIDDGMALFDLTFNVSITDDPAAPPCENEEEVITDVILTWSPINGGDTIRARAQDPDGPGVRDLEVLDDIELLESTEYTLTVELLNTIDDEDITEEIEDEDDEHQFFFAFTDQAFTSPAGDGNVDNRDDPIDYDDMDENGLPVGLKTLWETECAEIAGMMDTFRIVLKHQPDIKDDMSTAQDGETDIDLTFNVNINEDPDAPPCENEEEVITDVILT